MTTVSEFNFDRQTGKVYVEYDNGVNVTKDLSQAITGVYNTTTGQTVLDDASRAVLQASGAIVTRSVLKIAVLGDSISEGQTLRIPLPEFDSGWYSNATGISSTFLIGAICEQGCPANAPVAIDWDGVSKCRVQVNSDGYGPWVDVTGGGYFAAQSGTGYFVALKIRWRNRGAAQVFNGTNTAAGNRTLCRTFSGDFFGGALAAAGMMHNRIFNYAIGGDWAADVANRVGQVIALRPDLVMMMIGRNDLASGVDPTASIMATIDALVTAGIRVMYVDTIPNNYAGGNVALWVNSVAAVRRAIRENYSASVDVVDMALPYGDPLGATGNALVYADLFSDYIHTSIVGAYGKSAQIGADFLRRAFPSATWYRRSNGADVYNATTNPYGNMLGTRGSMVGTTGTISTTGAPSATGQLPTGWVDSQASGTFSTLTYTAPQSGSPIAKPGNLPGYFTRMVAANTSGSNAQRYINIPFDSNPVIGGYYRMGLTVRLTNATGFNQFEIITQLVGAGYLVQAMATGASPSLATATLSDSGLMTIVSEPFKIPAGTTGASFYIRVGCATGGGFTLDIADPWFAPA